LQKKQEEEALKGSMRQEIVRRIIRRLDGVAYRRQVPDAYRVAFV
jgi:outer membrane lipopolysaccharide assembly protein LptE/RlpB